MIILPIFENIPDELKHFPQWVNWQTVPRKEGEKPTKPPFQPNGKLAKTDDPATWSPFPVVKDAAPRFDGVGFVLTNGDPYVALDFDHCRCPAFDGVTPWGNSLDMVAPEIADYVRKLNSYTEVSPSRKGIRMFVRAKLPVDGKRKGPIEVYQNGRYVTLTGHVLDGCTRTIEHRQPEVDAFYRAVLEAIEKPPGQPKAPRATTDPNGWRNLLDVAFKSQNGPEIQSLWEGNIASYPSQSEADLALCHSLAFWLGGDPAAVDAAFRASGLYREKWDVKHHGDGRTYGEATIQKAIEGCTSFYGNPHSQEGETNASPEVWPEPIPFNDYSLLPDFPVDAIPGIYGSMVRELATSCQVDAGLPGSQMLAVLSAAIGARLKIHLDSHTEQGNLYLLSVIGSGNRKTEINSQLTAPLHAYQKARRDAISPIIREGENKMRILERRLEKLQKEAANKDDPNERNLLMRSCQEILNEIGQNPVPAMPTYLVDDVTLERLGSLMADNDERAAILSAEGGFFKLIAGLYSKGHANIDLILKAHAGDAWSSDRVGREGKAMERPALTLGLMVQPDVLEEIGRNSEFRGRGLSARFLYTWCQSKAGYRTRQTSPVSPNVKEAYHGGIVSLMGIEEKSDLKLSPEAQQIWNKFADDVEVLLRPGADLEHLVDWGSKLAGAVARISGLLHFAEHGRDGIGKTISPDSMSRSCYLGAYYIEHARAAFGIMKEDVRLSVARKILDYIKRYKPERFKGRDLFNHTNCASMDEITPGLTILMERGYIREVGRIEHRGRVGRPESTTFEVNAKSF